MFEEMILPSQMMMMPSSDNNNASPISRIETTFSSDDNNSVDSLEAAFFSSCRVASAISTGFQLSCWDKPSDNTSCDPNTPTSNPPLHHILPVSTSGNEASFDIENDVARIDDQKSGRRSDEPKGTRHVHFSVRVVTNEYDKPCAEDFFVLYYSAHELQRIRDQLRREEEGNKESYVEFSKQSS